MEYYNSNPHPYLRSNSYNLSSLSNDYMTIILVEVLYICAVLGLLILFLVKFQIKNPNPKKTVIRVRTPNLCPLPNTFIEISIRHRSGFQLSESDSESSSGPGSTAESDSSSTSFETKKDI